VHHAAHLDRLLPRAGTGTDVFCMCRKRIQDG
jgi:hypothetical protein